MPCSHCAVDMLRGGKSRLGSKILYLQRAMFPYYVLLFP